MTPEQLVTEFCAAWAEPDPATLAAYFTDDAVYHNIPMEAVHGRAAIEEFVTGFVAAFGGIDFRIHRQVANGNVVLNERTDVFTMNGRTIELPVMGGSFEVVDGKIAAWRDYFDMGPLTTPPPGSGGVRTESRQPKTPGPPASNTKRGGLVFVVPSAGFEPATSCSGGKRSIP